MAGALSDNDAQDANMLAMSQYAQQQNSGNNDGAVQGALSAASADAGGDAMNTYDPKEVRNLQLLEAARGYLQPTHTGSFGESLGNAVGNVATVSAAQMKQNATARAAMAKQQLIENARIQAATIGKEKGEDVAHILAGANTWKTLSPDEAKQIPGYAPGDVWQQNMRGQLQKKSSAPANQRVLTGYDKDGNASYADPGAALTPKLRSDYQEFLRQSNQVLPDLQKMVDHLNSDDVATGGIGATGYVERTLRGTVGQGLNAMGYKDVIGPEGATLRNNMSSLNALLRPVLQADPRSQAAHIGKEEIDDLLPNPDHIGVGLDDARTKYGGALKRLQERTGEYSQVLKGRSDITEGPASEQKDKKSIRQMPTPEEALAELARRRAAKATQGDQ